MTDESKTPTPSLRLKPRLRPAEGAVPVSPGPANPPAPVLFSDYPGPAGAVVPAPPPAPVISAAPATPPAPVAPAPSAPAPAEASKFRFKPRTEAAPVVSPETRAALSDPGATIPPAPQAAPATVPTRKPFTAPPPSSGGPPPPPAAPKPAASASRPPLAGYTAPPFSRTKAPFAVPHIKATVEVPEVEVPESHSERRGPRRFIIGGLTTLVVFGVGGFFAWQHFTAPKGTVAALATPPAVAGSPAKSTPASPAGSASPTGSSPSETLNKIAAIPGNAIAKAQDAIAARRASGQSRVDATAAGEDTPAKSAGSAAKAPPAGTSTAMTSVAPGLAATTQIEAAPEASPVFLAWVVNIKVNGVFQGTPARAMINGRLTRTGEVVDGNLGITFESVDADKKQLIFKDRSGATVTRKY